MKWISGQGTPPLELSFARLQFESVVVPPGGSRGSGQISTPYFYFSEIANKKQIIAPSTGPHEVLNAKQIIDQRYPEV